MRELADGTVWLDKGEPAPAYCANCQRFYPVTRASEVSECPRCGKTTIHGQITLERIYPAQGPGESER